MSSGSQVAPRYRTGDWITFRYGPRQIWAKVIEDRGNLGVNRRRLYRIRVDQEAGEPLAFEVPEDDLSPAVPLKEDLIRYLKEGGLAGILRSNLGGKQQPRVWLTLNARGNVTHTFLPDNGIIGGEVVPFWSLHDERIDRHKKDDVIKYLTSFGLSTTEAEDVVGAVGLTSQ